MAQAVPGTSAQRGPECLTTMPWEEADLNRQRVQKMMAEATPDDGVLVVAEPGLPKQGKAAVGAARRYAGPLGPGGHGHIAGTGCDTDPQAMWPVAVRRYWPKPWAQDPERRQQARGPAERSCQTTPAIALQLLDQARAWGVPPRGLIAEADDGDHPGVADRCTAAERAPLAVAHGALASRQPRLAAPAVCGGARLARDS
jgi:SRSO17 transposase